MSLYHKQFTPSLAAHSTYPFEEILIGTLISPTHYQSVGLGVGFGFLYGV